MSSVRDCCRRRESSKPCKPVVFYYFSSSSSFYSFVARSAGGSFSESIHIALFEVVLSRILLIQSGNHCGGHFVSEHSRIAVLQFVHSSSPSLHLSIHLVSLHESSRISTSGSSLCQIVHRSRHSSHSRVSAIRPFPFIPSSASLLQSLHISFVESVVLSILIHSSSSSIRVQFVGVLVALDVAILKVPST